MKNDLGFQFASSTCGFKQTKKPDLAVVFSPEPCKYAGVFTSNQVRAACVDANRDLLKKKKNVRAIVINSGTANACTGKDGIKAVNETKKMAAKLLGIKPDEVLVASTGSIGTKLDTEKMSKGLKSAIPALDPGKFKEAARAILTTDTYEKIAYASDKDFLISAFTKGAGMIHPNMATMLCYIFTDLKISQPLLQKALKEAVEISFNNISVDADMSTNDMVTLLSNCKSKKSVTSANSPIYKSFVKKLTDVCCKLARDVVLDGEGANKIIEAIVIGAKTQKNAREIARSIATSNLFKCAVYGSDPNWGRAASRVGCTTVKVDQNKLDIFMNGVCVFKSGEPVAFNKAKLHKDINKRKGLQVVVNLNLGKEGGSALGCEMTPEYVDFNAAYFT